MGKLKCKSDYEDLRNARILENQARLQSLGIHKTLSDLRSVTTSSSPKWERRKWTKRVYETAILRRSDRLKRISSVESSTQYSNNLSLRRSNRLKEISTEPIKAVVMRKVKVGDESEEEEDEKRPANAPLVKVKGVMQIQLSPEASAKRCSSKGRGTIYNSVFGICCHFCRQKTLCSEEDCKRCSNLDPDEPCIGSFRMLCEKQTVHFVILQLVFSVEVVSRSGMVKVSPSTKKEPAGTKPLSPVSVSSLKNLVMVFKAPKTTKMFI
ncbi:hypothetical protein H0E87_021501 [Populus deltoides]|uniref:Uncharacterized protein n=1 Tax=Populus deltoides TaxID=3696 RepID=A0A8T2XIQ6_POPDE|nr:hypothetical protein H0E87_021501 [Populus deltoides]